MWSISRTGAFLITVGALATPASAQDYDRSNPAGGPFSHRDAVLNAPFSADATTHIHTLLANGTSRIDTVTARYYRDSQGRVRAELDTRWGPYVVIEVPTTTAMRFYKVDLQKQTYQDAAGYWNASMLFNGEGRFALPLAKVCFLTAPAVLSNVPDDERLRAVNAQVSPDLGIVTASHRSDQMLIAVGTVAEQVLGPGALIAAVDYQVTNIRRDEPSSDLFDILTNYTFVQGSYNEPLWSFPSLKSRAMRAPPPGCNPQTR